MSLYGCAFQNSGRVYTRMNVYKCINTKNFKKKYVTFLHAFKHLAINQCSSKSENGLNTFVCLFYWFMLVILFTTAQSYIIVHY